MLWKELDRQWTLRKTKHGFQNLESEGDTEATYSEKPSNVKQEGRISNWNLRVDVINQPRKGW